MNPQAETRNYRSLMQSALVEIRGLKAKLKAVETAQTEPIAVIGMGCRFPGGADNPDAFWQLLRNGVDAITEIPADRWHLSDYYDPNPDTPGKTYSRYGGFVDRLQGFDAEFFGIADREAQSIDPQQRLLLEVCWEALEQAGIVPEFDQQAHRQTGVFVGISSNDYSQQLLTRSTDEIDAYLATGNSHSTAAGRISYTLGLTGPSLAIDTACSSSLVAVHLACQSLRVQECHLALVGGVNRIIAPEFSINFAKARMLAADGRCKTFAAAADGFVRSEGCGVIVLKRLSDAVADGDRILAVLRGSAVNQDGRSGGLTVPNGPAQQAVISQALLNSQLQPDQISYIEAHGTGTALGDPIEMNAIGSVFGASRSVPLVVGSVKTNIGHLEAAAGIAGLIKVILSLQHQEIPAHLHFQQPNPHIDWQRSPLVVPTQHQIWSSESSLRRAGVSSFGFSGTNAHVIVEAATVPSVTLPGSTRSATTKVEAALNASPSPDDRSQHLLTLSARTPAALRALANRYQHYLSQSTDGNWADICSCARTKRTHFSERLSLVADSKTAAAAQLANFVTDRENTSRSLLVGSIDTTPRQLVVLFAHTQFRADNPLKPQLFEQVQQLYQTQPAFQQAIDQCTQYLQPHLKTPLLEILSCQSCADRIDTENYFDLQLTVFAIQYALGQLVLDWQIQIDGFAGEGIGYCVAACTAGVFSLEAALKLVMTWLEATTSVDPTEKQTRFEQATQSLQYSFPQLPLYDRAGKSVENIVTPEYWQQQLTLGFTPVSSHSPQFLPQSLSQSLINANILLQVSLNTSPDSCDNQELTNSQGAAIDSSTHRALVKDTLTFTPGWQTILTTLAHLYVQGISINWQRIDRQHPRRFVQLPTYPFQHRSYWIERSPRSINSGSINSGSIDSENVHPLLGCKLNLARSQSIYFTGQISQNHPDYLSQHRVCGAVILPAAGYIEMALAAGRCAFSAQFPLQPLELTRLSLYQSLHLSSQVKPVQFILSPDSQFEILSQTSGSPDWLVHAIGSIRQLDHLPQPIIDRQAYQNQCLQEIELDQYYAALAAYGIDYGSDFQILQRLWRGTEQALGQLSIAQLSPTSHLYELHPILLDASFQVIGAALMRDELNVRSTDETYLPVGCDRLILYQAATTATCGDRVWSFAQLRPVSTASVSTAFVTTPQHSGIMPQQRLVDLTLFDAQGRVIVAVEGLRLQKIAALSPQRSSPRSQFQNWLYQMAWQPQSLPVGQPLAAVDSATNSADVILMDRQGVGQQLATALAAQGRTVIQVHDQDTCSSLAPLLAPLLTHQLNRATEQSNLQVGDRQFVLSPTSLEATQQLIQILSSRYSYLRVMHLWSLDLPDAGSLTNSPTDPLDVTLPVSLSLLYWLQASRNISVSVVTKGAIAIAGEPLPGLLQTPIWGLGKVAQLEHPEFACRCIDLDPESAVEEQVEQLILELQSTSPENQIAFRHHDRYVARLQSLQPSQPLERSIPHQPFRLVTSAPGTLENLTFQPTARRVPQSHEVEIRVWATGVNLIDVLDALNLLPFQRDEFGVECAGEIVAVGSAIETWQIGDRVVALAPDSYSQYVTIPAVLVAALPDHLSYEAAATIPANFLTAHYALRQVGQLRAGDRILIHAAAGGTGMAAVQIAQQVGVEVFATASPAKWQALKDLGVQHVMNSRTLDFAEQVMALTQGGGVDVVLNSLSGDYIPRSLSVLKSGGRFLEIGKRDVWTIAQVNASNPDIHYYLIDLLNLTQQQPQLIRSMLSELMVQFTTGVLSPLPHKVFPIQQIIPAFRYMQQARQIGKVVISQRNSNQVQEQDTQLIVRPDSTYLITGGCGGLGLLVTEWLVQQGATNLILVNRRSPSPKALETIERLKTTGTRITVAQADVSDRSQLSDLIRSLIYPLRGIIHAAGVLDDGLLTQMDEQRFRTVMTAKMSGAWYLHQLTQDQPLDFFVLFSSAASLLGSPGQANHVAANSFLDALAHYRRASGLPGLSINWGAWSEVGAAVDRLEQMRARGIEAIAPEQGISVLAQLMQQPIAQVGVLPIDWQRFKQNSMMSPLFEAVLFEAVLFETGLFETVSIAQASSLHQSHLHPQSQASQSPMLQQLSSAIDRPAALVAYLQQEIAKVLGLPPGRLPKPQQGFFDLGMDSLMTVELKNRLEANLAVPLSSTVLFEHPTILSLAQYLAEQLSEQFPEQFPEQLPEPLAEPPPPAIVPAATSPPPFDESDEPEQVPLREDEIYTSIEAELTALESLLKRS